MNFTLKQLRYVESTGRLGSIANAAMELNISQSSITAAIGALESQIGFDLFVRTPAKGISVTPAGREALRLIRGFIVQSRHFETEMMSVGGDASGSVRVSCYATAAPSFLPPILKKFRASHPTTSITLLEGNMEATLVYLSLFICVCCFFRFTHVGAAQQYLRQSCGGRSLAAKSKHTWTKISRNLKQIPCLKYMSITQRKHS